MQKKIAISLFFIFIAFGVHPVGYGNDKSVPVKEENPILAKLRNSPTSEEKSSLDPKRLFDTAVSLYAQKNYAQALTYYTLFIDVATETSNHNEQEKIVRALVSSANIYDHFANYHSAYELLISAIALSEEYKIPVWAGIYRSMGNIVYRFGNYELAKEHYERALELTDDSLQMASLLNNIGVVEMESGNIGKAFQYVNKSLDIFERQVNKDDRLYLRAIVYTTLASIYERMGKQDSTFHYYALSLDHARKANSPEIEAEILSDLAELYLNINKLHQAHEHVRQSNEIVDKSNFLRIKSKNHLILSKIEHARGNREVALDHLHEYINLKDSIQNTGIFSSINELDNHQQVYTTKQQINQLLMDLQKGKQKAHYQQIVLIVVCLALVVLIVVLMFILFQRKQLNEAYDVLVEKSLEDVDSQESQHEKYKKSSLSDDLQNELLDKILAAMKTSVIYDVDFTVDKLAELVQSNQTYVSQTINTVLKKNFRQFLNKYRIREAQRLFSEPDATKYTVDAIAFQVGFKSRSAFYTAFKEITGVTPNFYLKSTQNRTNG